jgi:hypothetical protein
MKHESLVKAGACEASLEFAEKYETIADVWSACGRVDWLLWMLSNLPHSSVEKSTYAEFARRCAEQANAEADVVAETAAWAAEDVASEDAAVWAAEDAVSAWKVHAEDAWTVARAADASARAAAAVRVAAVRAAAAARAWAERAAAAEAARKEQADWLRDLVGNPFES